MNVKKEAKERLTVMVRPSLREPLQRMADADDRSLGYMVERAIEAYLQNKRPPDPVKTHF